MNSTEKKRTVFENKILPALNYVGAIGAAIMCIAYIVLVIILIKGFKVEEVLQTTIFAFVNAGVGFIIMQFLKYQGICFAKVIPENKAITDIYYGSKTKDKKNHSLTYFWGTSIAKDAAIKCLSIAATSIGIIYIVIAGSNDYNLLLLAIVNLLMFICFGFLSLVKAYDYYNQTYISYVKERLEDVSVEIPQEPVVIDEATEESSDDEEGE